MRLFPLIVLCLSLAWPGAVCAQPVEAPKDLKVADFRAAFARWMQDAGATRGALALRRDGQAVAALGLGMDAGRPVDLASLSKAITGVCIARLVEDGALEYADHARAILNLAHAAPVSIAALLGHGSGLRRDHTQGPMAVWRNDPTPRWPRIARTALARDRISADTSYYYSNENYAVLGAVIEAVTGTDYETACRDRVLTPAGVTGRGSALASGYLPWGGWEMTVADYAAFLDHSFGPEGWLTDNIATLPRTRIVPDVYYGHGLVQRDHVGGTNLWHFGALCFEGGPNLGSYAVHWTNGWTVTAWYDACVTDDDMARLDRAMIGVAFAR
jgi:CubicO group peptidase (beta-lactamase class C family)